MVQSPNHSDTDRGYGVFLPCKPDQFKEFVAGLLGRPQTITGRVRGDFEIDRQSIETTYLLVEQRITSQNDSSRISFSISISYDDASTVTLDSYEDFVAYTETKPLLVTRVALSWVYLIQFRNRSVPERQQIDVWFAIRDQDERENYSPQLHYPLPLERHLERIHGRQGMMFRIMHTNRTWVNDLESLITSHLRTYLIPVSRVRVWMSSNSGWIGLFSGAAFEVASIIFLLKHLSEQTEAFRQRAKALTTDMPSDIAQISSRVDLIIDILSSRTVSTQGITVVLFILVSLLLAILIGALIGSKSSFPTMSYILINKTSEERKRRFVTYTENSPTKFALAVIGGITIGVVGNIAYYFLAKQLSLQ